MPGLRPGHNASMLFPRVLFICKTGSVYGGYAYTRRACGLFNSTSFVAEVLRDAGVTADIIEVVDNNCIDRAIAEHAASIVVLEALWVVPEKFQELRRLWPNVRFFVHMHSGLDFLAMEGIACDWLPRYAAEGVGIIANSCETFDAYRELIPEDMLWYLPNVYERPQLSVKDYARTKPTLDVACMGAIRPLKAQLAQAFAAIRCARQLRKHLNFYVNATRSESGDEVLKNLRGLFAHLPDATLVESPWRDPADFVQFLHDNIDIGLCVSLSETFCVVAADLVTAGVPIVASREVRWLSGVSKADDDNIDSTVAKMHYALGNRLLGWWNQWLLRWNRRLAVRAWLRFVRDI